MTSPIIVKERSGDRKLSANGGVSATWAPQSTCPSAEHGSAEPCPFLGAGCYAETGHSGIHTRRINKAAAGRLVESLALQEAEQIVESLSGTRKLRVHVVGDCPTPDSATLIAMAMDAHERKHGQPAWTYTHAWRDVPKDSWLDARVLASCHSAAEAAEAQNRGYAVALTTPEHPTNKLYQLAGLTVVPCPAQFKHGGTRVVTCEHCTLCQSPDLLREERLVVGFEPDHGTTSQVLQLIRSREEVPCTTT